MSEVVRIKRQPKLRVVDEPLDITGLIRRDIAVRDWSAVHIAGDKRPPLDFAWRRLRTWR